MPEEPITVEDNFAYYTTKSGDVARQLSLAGLALVWFTNAAIAPATDLAIKASPTLAPSLKFPAILMVVGLSIDTIQYVAGTAIWGWLYFDNKGDKAVSEFRGPDFLITIVILVKLLIMILAYGLLFRAIFQSSLF